MRIAMMSQWYDPEKGSAITAGSIARALRDLGNDVQVVTGFPNYPEGEVYPGYKVRPYQREVLEGITVHRSPLYISHDANPRRRAANYLSFAASASGVGLSRLGKIDATLVHSTPATVAIPAMTRRLLRRTPYVVHIQDLWPETVTASGLLDDRRNASVERLLHRFCDSVYRHASSIAVTSPGMADRVVARGFPAEKVSVIANWADERYFHPAVPSKGVMEVIGPRRPFTVMYAGAMGEVQALDTVIGAAEILKDRADIGFVLVGGGVAEAALKARAVRAGLTNVTFVSHQRVETMAELLSLGDVQVVSLRDNAVFETTVPSKLQAILAAGRPIICAVAGDAAKVVHDAGAGLTTQPESPTELAAAIGELASMSRSQRETLGENGFRYYQREFSQAHGAQALQVLLRNAAERRGAA